MTAGLPPDPALDPSISAGQSGHVTDHEVIAGTLAMLKEAAGMTVAEIETALGLGTAAAMTPTEVVEDAGAQASLSGAFVARDPIVIEAAAISGGGGAALNIIVTSNPALRVPSLNFDAAAYEAGYLLIPAARFTGWGSIDVSILAGNAGTGTGVVRWRAAHAWVTPTTTLNVGETTGSNIDWTATDRDVLAEVALASGIAVQAGKDLRLQIQRRAGDAEDTLANDAGVVRVILGKAS